MNRGDHQLVDWFCRYLIHEVNYGFKCLKPHVLTRNYVDEIDPRIGWRKLALYMKPPQTLKKVPSNTLPQCL